MSARTQVRDALKAQLTGWQIVADPRQLDVVTKPGAAVLATMKMTRPATYEFNYVQNDLVLWVLTATTKPELIEDDLDDLLLAALAVLEGIEGVLWTEAERGVLSETFEGWKVTLSCGFPLAALNPEPEP